MNSTQPSTAIAFFDLDGTLLPLPSLETRFFRLLRHRRRIELTNYFAWLNNAVRLVPRGVNQFLYANKAYLRGVSTAEHDALAIPSFFAPALHRALWHSGRGHQIVLLTGTIEALARRVAAALSISLEKLAASPTIHVCATRLEARNSAWTGRILGEAMFGEAKLRGVHQFAAARNIPLSDCFAYGDSALDRWMLDAVGHPAAVNPSDDLARIARRCDWPVLLWDEKRSSLAATCKSQRFPQPPQTIEAAASQLSRSKTASLQRLPAHAQKGCGS